MQMTSLPTHRLVAWLHNDSNSTIGKAVQRAIQAWSMQSIDNEHGCTGWEAWPSETISTLPPTQFLHIPPHARIGKSSLTGPYNHLNFTADNVTCESDPLGLLPMFYAETDGGVLIASHLTDLLRIAPELSAPYDPLGMGQMLAFGMPLGNRTVHAGIRRLPVGMRLHWTRSKGLQMLPGTRIVPPPPNMNTPVAVRCDQLLAKLHASINAYLPDRNERITLPLSGGFDSRLLAVALRESGYSLAPYTYGERHHQEVRMALRVAHQLGLTPNLLPFPDNRIDPWNQLYRTYIEGEASPALLQITNLLDTPENAPTTLVHGFIGEVLAGHHLAWLDDDDYRDHDSTALGLARHLLRGARLDAPQAERLGLDESTLAADIRSQIREDCEPYQSQILWDLENRQRRYIAMHLHVLSSRFRTVAPFYNRELIETWLSQPRELLAGRSLFRQLLARHFPAMARIPHSEEMHPILPDWHHRMQHAFTTRIRRPISSLIARLPIIGWRLQRQQRLRRQRWNPDIWALTYRPTEAQRAASRARVAAHLDTLQTCLGFSLGESDLTMMQSNSALLRNLDALASFAAYVGPSHP